MTKKTIEIIKENIKRAYGFNRMMRKHFASVLFLFILNVGFIFYVATGPREPSLQIFIAIWLISAFIIIRIFYTLYTENNAANLPLEYDYESKIRPAPLREIKAWITFIGHVHMRGFYARIYVYADEIIIRFHKRCLIIKNPSQIEINKFLFSYLVDFKVDDKFVQCSLSSKNAMLLEQWLKERNHKY